MIGNKNIPYYSYYYYQNAAFMAKYHEIDWPKLENGCYRVLLLIYQRQYKY